MSCETCTLDCPHKRGIHYDIWGEGIECKNQDEQLPWNDFDFERGKGKVERC